MKFLKVFLDDGCEIQAGQNLRGFVVLRNEKPRMFEALVVNIKGFALSMPRPYLPERKTFYHAFVEIFRKQEILEGLHRFDFQFVQLPPDLPQSFESVKGHIRYRVKAVLEISKDSKLDSSIFTNLKRIEDLNLFKSSVTEPYTNRIVHEFGLKGRLTMVVSLPHLGFTPGQMLKIAINYNNQSSVKVNKTRIILEQTVRHADDSSSHHEFYEKKCIYDVLVDGCDALTRSSSIENCFILPDELTLTSVTYCSILQIFYELKIKAIANGFHDNVTIEIPIIIGSIAINTEKRRRQNAEATANKMNLNEKSPLVTNNQVVTIDQVINPFPAKPEMTIYQIIFFLIFMFGFCMLVVWSFTHERN